MTAETFNSVQFVDCTTHVNSRIIIPRSVPCPVRHDAVNYVIAVTSLKESGQRQTTETERERERERERKRDFAGMLALSF